MLFIDEELKSVYDFENEISDHYTSLYALSKELVRITELLSQKKQVKLYHKNYFNQDMYINYQHINENTWLRSSSEIKELLYRSPINGKEQAQFSLSKNLKQLGIEEHIDYKQYLQILYFFYILNYFIYPSINIFKLISLENMEHIQSFSERILHTECLHFIKDNLLDHKDTAVIYSALEYNLQLKLNEYSYIIKYINQNIDDQDHLYTFIQMQNAPIKDFDEPSVYLKLLFYIKQYKHLSHSLDMVYNLKNNSSLFIFDSLTHPPESWKQRYIPVNKLDEFLKENETYMFIKDTHHFPLSKDKIKFMQSNAVKFFYNYIEYDKQWMIHNNEETEGMFIRVIDGELYIYALIAAVIIKTYNEVVNKMKYKVKTNQNRLFPIRSALTIDVLPSSLSARLLDLFAHSYYLSITKSHSYPDIFISDTYYTELIVLDTFTKIFTSSSYDQWMSDIDFYIQLSKVYYKIKTGEL